MTQIKILTRSGTVYKIRQAHEGHLEIKREPQENEELRWDNQWLPIDGDYSAAVGHPLVVAIQGDPRFTTLRFTSRIVAITPDEGNLTRVGSW